MELLGHMITLRRLLEKLPNCFLKCLLHSTIPVVPIFVIIFIFHLEYSHPKCGEMYHCGFDTYFPNSKDVDYLFMFSRTCEL